MPKSNKKRKNGKIKNMSDKKKNKNKKPELTLELVAQQTVTLFNMLQQQTEALQQCQNMNHVLYNLITEEGYDEKLAELHLEEDFPEDFIKENMIHVYRDIHWDQGKEEHIRIKGIHADYDMEAEEGTYTFTKGDHIITVEAENDRAALMALRKKLLKKEDKSVTPVEETPLEIVSEEAEQ